MGKRQFVSASTLPRPHPAGEGQSRCRPYLQISASHHREPTISIERVAWRLAADHERLRLVDLVFDPRTASLPGLVARASKLSDNGRVA